MADFMEWAPPSTPASRADLVRVSTDPLDIEQYTARMACPYVDPTPPPQKYVGPNGELLSTAEANVLRRARGLSELPADPPRGPDCGFAGEVIVTHDWQHRLQTPSGFLGVRYWTCPQCGHEHMTRSYEKPHARQQRDELVARQQKEHSDRAKRLERQLGIPWAVLLGLVVVGARQDMNLYVVFWFFTTVALIGWYWLESVGDQRPLRRQVSVLVSHMPGLRAVWLPFGWVVLWLMILATAAIGGAIMPGIILGLLSEWGA